MTPHAEIVLRFVLRELADEDGRLEITLADLAVASAWPTSLDHLRKRLGKLRDDGVLSYETTPGKHAAPYRIALHQTEGAGLRSVAPAHPHGFTASSSDAGRPSSEEPNLRAGSRSADDQSGRLAVREECPICGPLHSIPVDFDLVEHLRNVHGVELAAHERLRSSLRSGRASTPHRKRDSGSRRDASSLVTAPERPDPPPREGSGPLSGWRPSWADEPADLLSKGENARRMRELVDRVCRLAPVDAEVVEGGPCDDCRTDAHPRRRCGRFALCCSCHRRRRNVARRLVRSSSA